jgi:hypothetical protein
VTGLDYKYMWERALKRADQLAQELADTDRRANRLRAENLALRILLAVAVVAGVIIAALP